MKALLKFSVIVSVVDTFKFLLNVAKVEYLRAIGPKEEVLTYSGNSIMFENGHRAEGSEALRLIDGICWRRLWAYDSNQNRFNWSKNNLHAEFGEFGITDFSLQWVEWVIGKGGQSEFIDRLPRASHNRLPWERWQKQVLLQLNATEYDMVIVTLCRDLGVSHISDLAPMLSRGGMRIQKWELARAMRYTLPAAKLAA